MHGLGCFQRKLTWRTSCAPMFWNLFLNSMLLATVTPSLVIRGTPKDWSKMALRPLGPSVTFHVPMGTGSGSTVQGLSP